MARKGNQQKNNIDRKPANRRQTISDPTDISLPGKKEKSKRFNQSTVDEELSSSGNLHRPNSIPRERVGETNCIGSDKRNKQRHSEVLCREKSEAEPSESAQAVEPLSDAQDAAEENFPFETRGSDGMLSGSNHNPNLNVSEGFSVENIVGHVRYSVVMASQRLRFMALSVFNAASGWLEEQQPQLMTFKSYMCHASDYIIVQIKHLYPFIWMCVIRLGQLIFLLAVVWLDCNIRGINSLVRLGTTSFFTVVWCSILSVISMVGFTAAFVVMVISAVAGAFIGLALGILILAIFSIISLWLYGSFWTTSLVIFIGGSTFASNHERVALLVSTIYSVHCAKGYMGWPGLLLGLNLSFLSSDILTYFLNKNINEQQAHNSTEENRQTPNRSGHFYDEPSHFSPADESSASRGSDVPSTSGCEGESTSESEVFRLLNCNDHYSALGFARFENIDASLLKREYRKKAMLVHPDKNMGDEKAAEAFKKLQNAYEVLLDTLKRKTYDDELRREELLNYFRRFQGVHQKNGRHNIFNYGATHSGTREDGDREDSRRIACKRCDEFHKWTCTGRSKLQARWCQDCNDFHQAKDGDGWVEQSLHPFLFGLLHKVDAPSAYVCAEGRIYDATEWFICQGMRCPANTHKPSFHVNTTLSPKHNSSPKGTGSSHRGGGQMPNSNINGTMTEEEFFEWLQNTVQSGAFEASGGASNESPAARNGSTSRGGSSSFKKKKKGKKQW